MLKKLNLSQKVFVIFFPLFLAAVALSMYVSYKNQEKMALELLRGSAESQAAIIKESLVHMMLTNERVDDDYLARINKAGEIQNLNVWFVLDSLRLNPELLLPTRVARLHERELKESQGTWYFRDRVFTQGQSLWLVQCELGKHTHGVIEVFSTGRPTWLHSCERLKAILPFHAEKRCQECHRVPTGTVLGAAYMEIPLAETSAAFESNAQRSAAILLIFIAIAIALSALVFRKFISKPVQRLVEATHIIGSGNLDYRIRPEFGDDELGVLAESFDTMQDRLKKIREEMIHQERLSTVGRMASGIIHDFRSPMNAILLAIDMMQKNGSTVQRKGIDLYRSVRLSLERMQRMTQELLDYSRGEVTLNPRQIKVEAFVESVQQVVGEALQKKGIHFTVENICRCEATIDPDRLQRALINIINNAEDAMPKGGSISLKIVHENDSLIFSVSDTGGGIPESIRESIFKPFVTAGKSKGTGLGLAITKEIVEQHGGEISFKSEIAKGTSFYIKLPIQVQENLYQSSRSKK